MPAFAAPLEANHLGAAQPAADIARALWRRQQLKMGNLEVVRGRDQQVAQLTKRLTMPAATGNIYAPGGPLFALDGGDSIVALTLVNSYNPIFDMIGVDPTNVEAWVQNFITYVAASGAVAGSPTTGVMVDAATDPNTYEFGDVSLRIAGFTKLHRRGKVRDIAESGMRPTISTPTYRIDGSLITRDEEWDMVAHTSVLLQDWHKFFIIGDNGNTNESDGLQNQVIYGIVDADGGAAASYMDSTVIDWQAGTFQAAGAGVLLNNVATVALDGANIIDVIRAKVRRTMTQISHAPRMGGEPIFAILMPQSAMSGFLDAYAFYTIVGSVEFRKNLESGIMDALRRERQALSRQIIEGTVTLSFEGWPVTVVPYDYELRSDATDNKDMYFLTIGVGSQRFIRVHAKDMNNAIEGDSSDHYRTSDGGRLLHTTEHDWWAHVDGTRMDMRVVVSAPWAQMRIVDIASNNLLGDLSLDPESEAHWVIPNIP